MEMVITKEIIAGRNSLMHALHVLFVNYFLSTYPVVAKEELHKREIT